MSMIDAKSNRVEILVVTPTRELATQVSDELFTLGRESGINTVTVYGGSSYSSNRTYRQRCFSSCCNSGRLIDLLKNNRLRNFAPKIIVLDEADEMLDMGF